MDRLCYVQWCSFEWCKIKSCFFFIKYDNFCSYRYWTNYYEIVIDNVHNIGTTMFKFGQSIIFCLVSIYSFDCLRAQIKLSILILNTIDQIHQMSCIDYFSLFILFAMISTADTRQIYPLLNFTIPIYVDCSHPEMTWNLGFPVLRNQYRINKSSKKKVWVD